MDSSICLSFKAPSSPFGVLAEQFRNSVPAGPKGCFKDLSGARWKTRLLGRRGRHLKDPSAHRGSGGLTGCRCRRGRGRCGGSPGFPTSGKRLAKVRRWISKEMVDEVKQGRYCLVLQVHSIILRNDSLNLFYMLSTFLNGGFCSRGCLMARGNLFVSVGHGTHLK